MIFEEYSYRDYLKSVLIERKKVNKSYSLRAMAKQLGFSGSQLSEAISGKANFSEQALRKIAKKLKLNPKETEYLCLLGEFENQKDLSVREITLKKIQKLTQRKKPILDLSVDYFVQISDWYHSAILELVSIPNFNFEASNIAGLLKISKAEAELAIERLIRLGMLEESDRKFKRTVADFVIQSNEKNAAMKKFYRQMMSKASEALDEQNPTERWSGYETFPVAEEALPEIREACNRFFDEVLEISRNHPDPQNVFHMFTHLFNLTPQRKK